MDHRVVPPPTQTAGVSRMLLDKTLDVFIICCCAEYLDLGERQQPCAI
jgi:hypothetical protein